MQKCLSKSKYMSGLVCDRKLWLQLWRSDLKAKPEGMSALIMEQGTLFGELAHGLYPDGVLIDIDLRSLDTAEKDTTLAMNSEAQVVLEATFRSGLFRVLSDVVERQKDGSWHLIEVKSSTRVKPEHIPDLAYQRYVMEECGYEVSRCSVMHSNTAGRPSDFTSLFSVVDVTEDVVENQESVSVVLDRIKPLLEEQSVCPPLQLGKKCLGCEFKAHCWEAVERATIYEVINANRIADLETKQVLYVDDIPDDYPLSPAARIIVDRMQQRRVDVDGNCIKAMLGKLEYPLYFLDFESVSIALPLFEDSSPWRKYAFQYSLHIQHENGDVQHVEFLHEENSDPSEAIARSLVVNISDRGSVIVYSKTMEKGVLMDLARQFSDLAEPLIAMAKRIWDLELLFKKHYRHWEWGTKSSIKKVLPTLVPELSYKDLEIQEGGSATAQWIRMVQSDDQIEKEEIAENLRRYCELDTLAMVRLLGVVKGLY